MCQNEEIDIFEEGGEGSEFKGGGEFREEKNLQNVIPK